MRRSRKYNIICLIFEFLFFIKFKSQYVPNTIYYQEPLLNVKFMNLTLAGCFPFIKSGPILSEVTNQAGIVAAICQADKLNRKQYSEINFNGIINIAAQEYALPDQIGQFASMSLYKNSLYNVTTRQQLPSNNIYNLAGFFGALGSEINKIRAEISSGTAIPFVDPGTIDLFNFNFKTSVKSRSENRTYYQIRDTSIYNSVNVVINIMKAYNWTICGNIYQDNVLGLNAQQEIQTYASKYSSPIFTCNEIVTDEDLSKISNSQFITNYCTCMNNIRTLTVINLWTDPIAAYSLIADFKKKCSSASKYVFIMTGESKLLPEKFYETEIFKTALLIRTFGQWNFSAYIDECLATSSPQAVTAVSSVINEVLLNSFNCYAGSENSTLPLCPEFVFERTQPCICSGNEFDSEFNSYIVKSDNYDN